MINKDRMFLIVSTMFLMTCNGVFAMASDLEWTVRMSSPHRLSVENTNLFVDFSKEQAWTIRTVNYKGQEIVGEYGANGTVVNVAISEGMDPPDAWIGTGHGKEEVTRMTVLVDNEPHELQEGMTFSGKVITISKESKIGPFAHKAQITFPESGDCIIEKHSYHVLEELSERFKFVYAFMHCNNNALDQWLALLADGKEQEGLAGKKDNTFSLRKDIKGIIFFSKALSKGVVYVYPEVYQGADIFKNSIWDRERDNKLYFRPEVMAKGLKVGDEFELSLKVIPFLATEANWKSTGRTLAEFDAE